METNTAAAAAGLNGAAALIAARLARRNQKQRQAKTSAFELVEGSLKDGTARLRQLSGLATSAKIARTEFGAKKFRGIAVVMRIEEVRASEDEHISYKSIDLAKASVEPAATPPSA